jgi:8-oxo-dGTP pyrophosphatase MutT (NUDIX family)
VPEFPVIPLDQIIMTVAPWSWPFARERREEIAAHFARRRARTPELWNGRVLLSHHFDIAGRVLTGGCFETDFASLIAWLDWGHPDRSVTTCFSMAALRAADGGFLLGVMAAHTANAGQVYFPAGTLDPVDIVDGRLDFDASVSREVTEETGLTAADFVVQPTWHAVLTGSRNAFMKIHDSPEAAEPLRARILANLGGQAKPEFSDIRIARGPADLSAEMPDHVRAFLTHVWMTERP